MMNFAGERRPDLAAIREAAERISGAVRNTRFERSRAFSEATGSDVFLKFENRQFTGSFKERGALNRLLTLSSEQRARGVIAMSAGNHAQGVAYHASRLGIPSVIVMAEGTPFLKIDRTRRLGAQVQLAGSSLEEAAAAAHQRARDEGLTFVHPYDDWQIIAGQGTVALEMLESVGDLDILIVPIGGGGLISGIAIAAKSIRPEISVIGVQAARSPAAYNLYKGTELRVRTDTLAEGIAVKAPGERTMHVIRELVDDIVLVDEAAMEGAVARLIESEKTVVEGAGAAGLAALFADRGHYVGRKVGLVLCGGNIDSRLLASVLTRELAREGRLAELSIDLEDRPGQLARVAQLIGDVGANVVEVAHQRTFTDLPAKGALLEVVVETRDRAHLDETVMMLRMNGFELAVNTAKSGSAR